MNLKTIFLAFVLTSTAAMASAETVNPANSPNPAAVFGLWLTQSKTGHVDIQDCGDGTPCGTLVWISAPDPTQELDNANPDPALQSRSLVGIPLIWGFKQHRKGWKKGMIYSPEEGKTYRSAIALADDGTLKVKGCIGPICKTQTWTKLDTKAKAN